MPQRPWRRVVASLFGGIPAAGSEKFAWQTAARRLVWSTNPSACRDRGGCRVGQGTGWRGRHRVRHRWERRRWFRPWPRLRSRVGRYLFHLIRVRRRNFLRQRPGVRVFVWPGLWLRRWTRHVRGRLFRVRHGSISSVASKEEPRARFDVPKNASTTGARRLRAGQAASGPSYDSPSSVT